MSLLSMDVSSITMQPGTAAHEPLLFELFAENKALELACLGTGEPLQWLLEMQYRARCSGYRQNFPAAVQHVVFDEIGTPVGHALVHEQDTTVRLVDLSIRSSQRGKGLGSAAIQLLQESAAATGKTLRLQVVPSSPARRLYERLGFDVITESALACEMVWSAAKQLEMSEA